MSSQDIVSGLRLVEFGAHTEFAGFVELDKTGTKIRSVGDRQYIITAEQCDHLKRQGIEYEILKHL